MCEICIMPMNKPFNMQEFQKYAAYDENGKYIVGENDPFSRAVSFFENKLEAAKVCCLRKSYYREGDLVIETQGNVYRVTQIVVFRVNGKQLLRVRIGK